MKHCGTKKIDTPRLILDKVNPSEAKILFDAMLSRDLVTYYMPFGTYTSLDEAYKYYCKVYSQYDEKHYYWFIRLKNSDIPIGTISATVLKEDVGSFSIGYCLSDDYWSNGYMTEALIALTCYLFENTDCTRIQLTHDRRNVGSGRVMEKAGYILEGTLRRANISGKAGIGDINFYAMLRSDWEDVYGYSTVQKGDSNTSV